MRDATGVSTLRNSSECHTADADSVVAVVKWYLSTHLSLSDHRIQDALATLAQTLIDV